MVKPQSITMCDHGNYTLITDTDRSIEVSVSQSDFPVLASMLGFGDEMLIRKHMVFAQHWDGVILDMDVEL